MRLESLKAKGTSLDPAKNYTYYEKWHQSFLQSLSEQKAKKEAEIAAMKEAE